MNFLLDVNVLVASGWDDHVSHLRTMKWLRARIRGREDRILTSPIPQLGFVRVSIQRSNGQLSPAMAARKLGEIQAWLGAAHQFVVDDLPALVWPAGCVTASRTTDAHLLDLAKAHGAQLATLDAGIPGAFVIP